MKDFKNGRIYDGSFWDQIAEDWDSNKPTFLKKYDNYMGTGPSYNSSSLKTGTGAQASKMLWGIVKLIIFVFKLIFKLVFYAGKGLVQLIIGIADQRKFNRVNQTSNPKAVNPSGHRPDQDDDYMKFMK